MRLSASALAFIACAGTGTGASVGHAPAISRSVSRSFATATSPEAAKGSPKEAQHLRADEVRARCETEIRRTEAAPSLPGAPSLEAHRAEIFFRAKADPVLFVRSPAARDLDPEAAHLRQILDTSDHAAVALYEIYGRFAKRSELARQVLLREGYLYAESPGFAAALTDLVHPEDLFQDPEIWIARSAATIRLERRSVAGDRVYVYAEGPQAGERARLFLFDRVANQRAALEAPLHRDVSGVARALGFSELRVRRITESAVIADARYEDDWVPTLLSTRGAELSFSCEAIPRGREDAIFSARASAVRADRVLQELRRVMQEQVREALPFDEPKTEVGQEDGKLRQHWRWAYQFGQTQFDYNEDRYRVFDSQGRPRVPQVCIDFITDTFERASGSWYRPRGEPRERIQGRLDFTALGIDNERSVERFVEFAKGHPDWFEVEELAPEERVPYVRRKEFFTRLFERRSHYRPGDIVTIHGLRDDEKMHYHSFFVYDADPITGVPSLVAANAGRPRIRPWESEMTSAPRRSIRARIHPRLAWLESVVGLGAVAPASGANPTTTEL